MKGVALTFKKNIQTSVDDMNNPVSTTVDVVVQNCLVAPIIEPSNIREEQAMAQARDQIRIHMPKVSKDDVSGSTVAWGGKIFQIDSDSVVFMNDNTPTAWNRYFRAEFVSNYQTESSQVTSNASVYWGTNSNATLSGGEVKDLQNTTLSTTLARQFTLNGNGQYLYYAYPAAYGEAVFNVNGFLNNAWIFNQVTVETNDGNVLYDVYRSLTVQYGAGIQIGITES